MMNDGGTWIFENGTKADGALGAWYKNYRVPTVFIQTDAKEAEGTQRTIIRGCSRFN